MALKRDVPKWPDDLLENFSKLALVFNHYLYYDDVDI